jgi:hypothetical protein
MTNIKTSTLFVEEKIFLATNSDSAKMKKITLPHLDAIHTVSEKETSPDIAAIFTDIKETLGVPFVNLIWRHLATIPGGLAMTWSLAKPLYASKILNESARALRRQTALVETLSPWPESLLAALGLSLQDKSEIVLLLEDYGHANSRALLILSYLHASLSAQLSAPGRGEGNVAQPLSRIDPIAVLEKNNETSIKPARPLPAPAEMTAEVAKLVKILNTFGESMPSPAEPSLYRHLSYWPSFLAAFWLAVEPMERQGLLVLEATDLYARASSMVGQWKPVLYSDETMSPETLTQVLKSLDHFTYAVIGRMIVHGDMMKRMID